MNGPDRMTIVTTDKEFAEMFLQNKETELKIQIGNHASIWKTHRWSHLLQHRSIEHFTIELARLEKP
jgi:hypothetical protein